MEWIILSNLMLIRPGSHGSGVRTIQLSVPVQKKCIYIYIVNLFILIINYMSIFLLQTTVFSFRTTFLHHQHLSISRHLSFRNFSVLSFYCKEIKSETSSEHLGFIKKDDTTHFHQYLKHKLIEKYANLMHKMILT